MKIIRTRFRYVSWTEDLRDQAIAKLEEMAASEKASAELKTAVANFLASKDDTKKNAADVAALIPEVEKAAKEGCPLASEVLAKKDTSLRSLYGSSVVMVGLTISVSAVLTMYLLR